MRFRAPVMVLGAGQRQTVSILLRVGERLELPPELIVFTDLFPHRTHDVDHLPVSDPLAAGSFPLLAHRPPNGLRHALPDTIC